MAPAKIFDKESDYYTKQFSSLSLVEQTLTGKAFEECDFKQCNFSEATLKNCKFIDCGFVDCNLSNVKPGGTKLHNVVFTDCKVIGIDWTKAAWPRFAQWPLLQFRKSVLNDSSFFGLQLEELVIEECKAHEVDFREGNFSRADFTHSDLARSLFGRTNLTGTNFTEAINYDLDPRENEISGARFSRHEAVRLLLGFGIELVD